MIRRKRGLLLLALVTIVVGLVALFPARVAYQLASPPHVAMSGLSGTVWRGSAREFSTNGVYLRGLEWRIRPLKLLSGKAVYALSGSPVSGFFNSEVAISPTGALTLRDLQAALPLQMFAQAVGVPGLRGNASAQFEKLQLIDGRAAAMDGTLEVSGLVVPLIGQSSLGGYRAEFFTQNNGIVASIEDTDGVVDLAGSLQINPDKTYSFLGQLVAKPSTPESLQQRLQYLPRTDRPGQFELRLDGSY